MLLGSPRGMLKAKPPETSVLTKIKNEGFIVINKTVTFWIEV